LPRSSLRRFPPFYIEKGIRGGGRLVEHLFLLLFVDGVLAIDRFLQKRVRRAVPDFDALWNDPAAELARQEVVIGPLRRYAVSTMLGLAVGLVISCGFTLSELERKGPRPAAPPPAHEVALAVAAFFVPPAVAVAVFLYLLRGGELVLRADGVVLRYRRTMVYCPWTLFRLPGEGWKQDRSHLVVPVWPPAVKEVVQGWEGDVRATGQGVRSKSLYFLSHREAVLADLYAVRLEDVGELLLHLGHKLGTVPPSA
jgi:hypothetical protein